MIILILLMIFHICTTINATYPLIQNNGPCHCYGASLDDIGVHYKDNLNTEFKAHVKSWEDLQIICSNPEGLFSDFKLSSGLYGKRINSLHFKNCILSKENNLRQFMRRLGVHQTKSFSFQSFKVLNESLTKNHLQGISYVKKLDLSHNGLNYIESNIFSDFPELERLDLSNNNLTLPDDIFDATPNITHLHLSKNNIITISPKLFYKLKNLKYLDLKENRLEVFEDNVFSKLESLKSLNLSGNNITQISPYTFRELKKLEKLDISNNYFISVPYDSFKHNTVLKHIFFHDNNVNITALPNYLLSSMANLENAYLYNNGITEVPLTLFWYSPRIKYINLDDNLLITIPDHSFNELRNLEKLLVRNNKIRNIPIKIFSELEKLQVLDLSGNLLDRIQRDLFQGLKSLTTLNMENNQINFIDKEAFFPLGKLSIIKLSNNKIKFCCTSSKWSPFFTNTLLTELYLSNNKIESLYEDWTVSRSMLRILNLSHNNITTVSTSIFHFPSGQIEVDLRYNNIRNFLLNGIEDSAAYQYHKRDVVILLDHNPLLCDCHLYDFIRYYNNEMPEYVYNYFQIRAKNFMCFYNNGTIGPKIKKLNSTAYICPEDEYFNLKGYCQIGCTCSLRPKDKTRILDCSNKNMSKFVINMERMISVKDYNIMLNLTGNALTSIPSVEILKPTKILELHNNHILRIDSMTVTYFDSGFLRELTLSGNPIICDCNTQYFYYFVQSKGFVFKDLEKIKCFDSDLYLYNMTIDQLCAQIPVPNNETVLLAEPSI
ncbi:hypothetical protein M0802_011855 [Mischocyttarus mexicanus]|nr:hypothetical protein M0802_011855 [Mischocyttarus mexicanus]